MTIPAGVLAALSAIVGPGWVRQSDAELETYAGDGLPTHRSRPGAVVIPGTREEVIRIVRELASHSIPFVARGAGTGLSGGALASDDAVLVVLTRLTRILEVDPANRLAVVEPGVVNVRLSAAAAPHGLHYAPDPSSQTVCTIGGNVAENAGGPHCLKYGVTTNHVLELEVVLPDGGVATLGSRNGEPWGPDLVGLFVGSEGLFGIATRITVRLTPVPTAVRTLLADFAALRTAGEAVSAIIRSGLVPAALEMMDRNCIGVVEASIYAAGYPTDAAAVLLVELDGADEDAVAAECAEVELLLRAVKSLAQAAADAGVSVVAGDTKVVPRGHGGGIYFSVSGVGEQDSGLHLGMHKIQSGDRILVSGTIGDHGTAVLLAREEFGLSGKVESDCGSVLELVQSLSGIEGVHFLRDPTRGGLATVAHEVAVATGHRIRLDESVIPVRDSVRSVCEILGYDPLYLACEGRAVAFVSADIAEKVLHIWRQQAAGSGAAVIGIVEKGEAEVLLQTPIGGVRMLEELEDDPLPRIC